MQQRVWSPALVAVCLGYFLVILDTTIVTVALPALRADLDVGMSGLQWVVDGYLLAFAALLLSGGALADRFGALRVFQIGVGVFVAASLACGFAPTLPALVAGRLVQGAGAAAAVPASLALLRAAYPGRAARARAVGIWGGIAGLAAVAGPVLGGVLVTAVSWRLVFLVNVPIGLAGVVLAGRWAPDPSPRPGGLDPAGQLSGVLALAALTWLLVEGGGLAATAVAAGVFAAAAAGFLLIERRAAAPMLPLPLFRRAGFSAATAVGLLINLGFYGELFVLSLYFQQVLGYSPLLAGVAMLPQLGVATVASTLSGRFTARMGGPRPTMLLGLCAGAGGLAGLALAGSGTPYWLLAVSMFGVGFGMAFTMPAMTTAVVDAVPAERAGLASGTVNAARQVGSVLGVALLGALAGSGTTVLPGRWIALLAAAAAFVAGAVLTGVAVGNPRHL